MTGRHQSPGQQEDTVPHGHCVFEHSKVSAAGLRAPILVGGISPGIGVGAGTLLFPTALNAVPHARITALFGFAVYPSYHVLSGCVHVEACAPMPYTHARATSR